jgi:hypothetical protein
VKDLVVYSFRPTMKFSHSNMWILMVRPRNRLKLPARFISPLLIDFQSPSHTSSTTPFTGSRLVLHGVCCMASIPNFQYYSVYWFTTGTTWSLLHGHCSQTSSTTLFTGSWLVLHGVYWRGLAPILPVTPRLLVSTRTLCYWRGLAPILPVTPRLLVSD